MRTGVVACEAIRACLTPDAGTRWVGLAAGWSQTCGVTDTGALHCWGNCAEKPQWNPAGRFSEVATAITSSQPSAGDAPPVRICAVRADVDELVCWDEFRRVERHAGRFHGITVAAFHYCAIDADKIAHCWGDDTYGQTGWAAVNAGLTEPKRARSVSAGTSHTCVIYEPDSNGECFGNDNYNQSGTWPPVKQLLAHYGTTCGLESADGFLRCKGYTRNHLGWNGWDEPETPYVSVVLGGHGFGPWELTRSVGLSQCGIRKDGEAECVGLVFVNQEYDVSYDWPGAPPSPGPYQSLAAGFEHVCAIRKDGDGVVCWGVDDPAVTTPPEL
jgi:hypothetical protein